MSARQFVRQTAIRLPPTVVARCCRRVPEELAKGLIQPIGDFSEASIGAGFVLVAARRATDANCADRLVSDLDRDAALDSNELSIVERGIERARRSNLLGQVSSRDAPYGCRIGFATTKAPGQRTCTIANEK